MSDALEVKIFGIKVPKALIGGNAEDSIKWAADRIHSLEAQVKIEQDVAISLGEQLTEATARLEEAKKEIQRLKDHIFMCKTDQYKKLIDELEEAKKEIERMNVFRSFPFGCDNAEHMADEITRLKRELEEAKTSAVQSFMDNPKNPLIAKLAELQKQNTLLHDMLNASEKCIVLANDEMARLKEALEWGLGSGDEVTRKKCSEALQQLSNQGDGK